jgi:N-acetylglutamate synthase-like GNAT family acetyltransferase
MEMRKARIDDAAGIAELLVQLGYPAEEAAVRGRLERLERSEADATWVAVADGELIGLVGIHVAQVLAYDGDAANVSEIVVDDRCRRRGIGARLMQVAEEEARRRGCVVLFLTTAERRKDAHAFYRRLGFEETGRRFAKSLDQP